MSHLSFQFWHFSPIFVQLTCLVTLFDPNLQVFKIDFFGIFNNFYPLKNVNVARFARNDECDFFYDFQTPCI